MTGIANDMVKEHVDLVWSEDDLATTAKFFKRFGATQPADDNAFEKARNERRMKHSIIGKLIWNSFTPSYQLEMLTEEDTFKRGMDHDGLLLWIKTVDNVNPSTKVSVSNVKDELKNAQLETFDYDIRKFNTWFNDKRNIIVKEIGKDGYKEYLRCLFKTYSTAKNQKFLDNIEEERRKWMMDEQKPSYDYSDLMEYASK
eukprot:15345905-Ditylum_brightwellii.AAC.1